MNRGANTKTEPSPTTSVTRMTKDATVHGRSPASFWVLALFAAILCLSPFVLISFPPATDLPQHLGQIYLLDETLEGNTDAFSVNWYAPNNLIYLLLAANSYLIPPPLSGKMTMLILVLLWTGAVFVLSRDRNRAAENAVLAVMLTYNLSLYWGFLNFMIGWPFFVLWLSQSLKPMNKRRWLNLFLLSVLLYASHALWFVIGSVWLFIRVIEQRDWRHILHRMSPVLPIGLVAILWYTHLSSAREAAGFDTAPYWFKAPYARLAPDYLVDSMFGGIKGILEPLAGVAILGWILIALYTNRGYLKERIDTPLVTCALMFVAIALFAPDRYMNTIYFAQRWFPCAIILLILALPRPVAKMHLTRALVIGVLLLFSVQTARSWYLFERRELSGLRESLNVLPQNQRVLGLEFVKTSAYLKGRPFLQVFAYAQVFKGGDLNFSFAEHSSGIVSYKNPRRKDWTYGLVWSSEKVALDDFQHFDYVLVNGDAAFHTRMSTLQTINPVSATGRWHLYQVLR